MGLIISHASALEVIRRLRASGEDLRNYPFYAPLTRPSVWIGKRWTKRAFLYEEWLWGQPSPTKHLDVLVPSANDRMRMSVLDSHVCSANLPPNSILWLNECSSVVGPALLFMQLAETLKFSELVLLGHELCGTYALDADCPEHGEAILDIPPAVTVEELRQFLDGVPRKRGVAPAREALRYISDGAASVMEGVLATVYSLSDSWCGYGMGPLRLNECVPIPQEIRTGNHRYRKPDILFPFCKVGINYDGGEHLKLEELLGALKLCVGQDTTPETRALLEKQVQDVRNKVVDDMDRDRELMARGYMVLRVMKEDLYELGGLDRFTAQLLSCARNFYGVETTKFERILANSEKVRDRQTLLSSLLPARAVDSRNEAGNE